MTTAHTRSFRAARVRVCVKTGGGSEQKAVEAVSSFAQYEDGAEGGVRRSKRRFARRKPERTRSAFSSDGTRSLPASIRSRRPPTRDAEIAAFLVVL